MELDRRARSQSAARGGGGVSDKSTIEWTDATWNPVTCTKVSAGCKNCYAERLFHRAYGREAIMTPSGHYHDGKELLGARIREFTDISIHPERLDQPLRWKKSRRIFVNSMSDLFHEGVPDDFIGKCFYIMAHAAHHTFQVLTKRPERMERWFNEFLWLKNQLRKEDYPAPTFFGSGWPLKNVWLGVSVEDQATANDRIPLLLQTPAAVRFVSYEPALGPVNLQSIDTGDAILYPLRTWIDVEGRGRAPCPRIDWIIAGGESGPNARPSHPDWFRSVRDQCAAAGVPFFFKQFGEWLPRSHSAAGMMPRAGQWGTVIANGTFFSQTTAFNGHDDDGSGEAIMFRVGKKIARRLLDGRTHDEYPA